MTGRGLGKSNVLRCRRDAVQTGLFGDQPDLREVEIIYMHAMHILDEACRIVSGKDRRYQFMCVVEFKSAKASAPPARH